MKIIYENTLKQRNICILKLKCNESHTAVLYNWFTIWALNDEDRQSTTAHRDINWFRIEREDTSLCHTEGWQVKQTALFIWLLLTSGSHCLKEVPASVLDLLAIKVQFNQNLKETWGLKLIHPCWPHVGHAGCQCFQTQWVADSSIFKQG